MNDTEDQISDYVYENGLSSSSIKIIEDNKEKISSSFLTDVLVENINLHLNHKLLLDFLPDIWKEDNDSPNLLIYLAGILHKLFYLARERPLGKEISDFYKRELAFFHQALCNFRDECLEAIEILEHYQVGNIDSFKELINSLNSLPKMSMEVAEMLRITSVLFYQFATQKSQKLKNIDELGLFLSRCLILWKLKIMSDEEFEECLNQAGSKYDEIIDENKLVEILSLEVQSYQFLQYGISHDNIKLIVSAFKRINNMKK